MPPVNLTVNQSSIRSIDVFEIHSNPRSTGYFEENTRV